MAFAVAFVASLLAAPAVIWLAHRWRLLDVPNHRSSHSIAVPRGGGIAVACGAMLGCVMVDWSEDLAVIAASACALGLVGLLDDRYRLPAPPRLLAQLLIAAGAAGFVARGDGASGVADWVLVVIGTIWVAGYVNTFNFMDGINGVSGTQAALAGSFLAVAAGPDLVDSGALSDAGWVITAAVLGFLPFNLPRARLFLGDVGSYFIGTWLAVSALVAIEAGASVATVLGPFVFYLCDVSTTLARRLARREPIMEAHREHAYQLLVAQGRSHAAVTALCGAVTLVSLVMSYLARGAAAGVRWAAIAGAVAVALAFVSWPHRVRHRTEGVA